MFYKQLLMIYANRLPLLFTGIFFLIIACNPPQTEKSNDGNNNNDSEIQFTDPVETEDPNTDYKPAFEGQTRAPGVETTTDYQVTILSEDLEKPWGITNLPDGRFLITEKGGVMRIASQDGTLSDAITGLPEVDDEGQGGLLGLRSEERRVGKEGRYRWWR